MKLRQSNDLGNVDHALFSDIGGGEGDAAEKDVNNCHFCLFLLSCHQPIL